MRKLKNILISGILSVCMVVISLPVELLAQEVETVQEDTQENIHSDEHQDTRREIVSFTELPDEVKDQVVGVGTPVESLELPDTLTVICCISNEKKSEGGSTDSDKEPDSEKDDKQPDEGKEEKPEGDSDKENENESGDTDKENEDESGDSDNKSGDDSENSDNGDVEQPEDSGKDSEGTTEGDTDEENGDAFETGEDDESGETSGVEGNTGVDNEDGAEGESTRENTDSTEDNNAIEKQETVTVTMPENYAMPNAAAELKELSYEAETAVSEIKSEESSDSLDEASDIEKSSEETDEKEEEETSQEFEAEVKIENGTEVVTINELETEKETEISEETVTVDSVTWKSMPEYDSEIEGVYIFTPAISDGVYTLADNVVLPEIRVTVAEAEIMLEETELPDVSGSETPMCSVISTDTVWDSSVTLSDCELIVKPGVTLTINDVINISGNVTIKGGGTIKRGSRYAYFSVCSDADFTVGEITLDGNSVSTGMPMIEAHNAKLTLDDGCRIRNCTTVYCMGAVLFMGGGEAVLNNVIIENCINDCFGCDGGTIVLNECVMTVNGGTYRNNEAKAAYGYAASVIYSWSSKLYIYGGAFINNMVYDAILGGCILDAGLTNNGFSNETHLYGGYFEGNNSDCEETSGGAIHLISETAHYDPIDENTIFEIAGDVQFCGDGVEGSGTDGVFLDFGEIYRKMHIGSPLTSPIYVYLKEQEGYVIAKGSSGYLLTEKDMKQIHFTDVGNSGKKYYAWLDKGKNEIYLSENVPTYGLYVYYSSNGAKGTVEDDTEYESGADVTVKSAETLSMEGCTFKEWNTKQDGKGEPYVPGTTFKITDDITLYAIFKEGRNLNVDFYSGGPNQKEVILGFLATGDDSVTIDAPELDDMEGWTKLGWTPNKDSYTASTAAGEKLSISKDTSYYGIYEKTVKLSYNANNANAGTNIPSDETGKCFANVHENITYKTAGFEVAGDITADNPGWEFAGWNTKPDGTGDLYKEGDQIEITEDTTLYAAFDIYPYAYFYSGKAGEREVKKTNALTKTIIAPPLMEKNGWKEIGWDKNRDSYEGSIEQGSVITALTDNVSFYGVYKKEVTLSYKILNNEAGSTNLSQSSTQTRYANVHEEAVTYKDFVSGDFVSGDSVSDDPDSFEFDIAPDISQDGYEFLGWNTREDGTGAFYRAADTARNKISIKEDTVLYAILRVPPAATFYSGDAIHRKEIKANFTNGINATVMAPDLEEMGGWIPLGWSTDETGYSGSIAAGSIISLTEDTSYYGIYKKEVELLYDANGWVADTPEKQSGFCYANVHEDITCEPVRFDTIPPISRAGYRFIGWSTSKDTTALPMPDYYRPGESIDIENSVTLYAQLIDDIAPVLGEAYYNSGYKDIGNWLVRKKELVITVPITEEGSGVNKIVYTLTPENGEPVTGEALMGEAYVPRQVRQASVVQLDVAGGQVITTDGKIQARITISEDYKGTVSLKCLDNAGNESSDKLLTATGGGVIVEDNAPQISFVNKDINNSKAVVTVSVSDDMDTDKNSRITGGIASITYQIDNKQEQNITTKNFAEEIVPSCEFSVDISGSGEHTLKVTAVDNAGNESRQSTQVTIAAKSKKTTVIKQSNSNPPTEDKNEFVPLVKLDKPELKPELPKSSEPATGDNSMRVEVYATIAMIAGLLYVLLYFSTGNNGMTEEEKNEFVSRILTWAKRGGKFRKYVAIAAIFCVLLYYHSIGKSIKITALLSKV